jgi:hypothetical protein
MAIPNVGNITPRANVCTCICGRSGILCNCDCMQTNEIGITRNLTEMPAASLEQQELS